jgi:PAS domain-containing protein
MPQEQNVMHLPIAGDAGKKDHADHADHANHELALQLMELLAIPTFAINAQGRVLIWNRACERLTGVPAASVLGTDQHWRCFYSMPRPTLADLVLQDRNAGRPGVARPPVRRAPAI